MPFHRRWSSCAALWLLCAGWFGAGRPPVAAPPSVAAAPSAGAAPAGPVGRAAAHFDGDHLPDYVTGRMTAGGRYLIEVCLSSRPGRTTIRTGGIGFAVQDVNADNVADLVIADGLGGSLTKLENNGRGHFTARVAAVPLPGSGPAPDETMAAAAFADQSPPPQPVLTPGRRPVVPASPPFGRSWRAAHPPGVGCAPQAAPLSRGPPHVS